MEIIKKCEALQLSPKATSYILKEYELIEEWYQENDEPSCVGYRKEEDGRIGYGQSHETAFENLAEAMGYDLDDPSLLDDKRLLEVWDTFFCE